MEMTEHIPKSDLLIAMLPHTTKTALKKRYFMMLSALNGRMNDELEGILKEAIVA
jgi:hypothetical protein